MRASALESDSLLQLSLCRIRVDVDQSFAALLKAAPTRPARLYEAMRYAAIGGGKRLRPLLVTAVAHLFDVPRCRALRAGVAAECVHTQSLIHDDLPSMDDDDLRRGRPTLHRAFDEPTALLAGDSLLALAFEILSDPNTHPDPQIRMDLASSLASRIGAAGMAGGQMLDLLQTRDMLIDGMAVRQLQELKTGALFGWCAEAAALLGRAPPHALQAVTAYARCLGLAFQMTDDLIDAGGSEKAAGKRVRKDHARGKTTMVQLLGFEAARGESDYLIRRAIENVERFGPRAQLLIDLAQFVAGRQF